MQCESCCYYNEKYGVCENENAIFEHGDICTCKIYSDDYVKIYNQAIDDFVKLAEDHKFKYNTIGISDCVVDVIEYFANLLKVGGKNE